MGWCVIDVTWRWISAAWQGLMLCKVKLWEVHIFIRKVVWKQTERKQLVHVWDAELTIDTWISISLRFFFLEEFCKSIVKVFVKNNLMLCHFRLRTKTISTKFIKTRLNCAWSDIFVSKTKNLMFWCFLKLIRKF